MWLDIDPRSSTPIYMQLVQGIKEAIARGILQAGDRMPTVRDLASDLRINPNTIAKAYQHLEQDGIIETMRSRGTFVAAEAVNLNKELSCQKLDEQIQALLVEAFHLGIDHAELLRLFNQNLQEWEQKREGK